MRVFVVAWVLAAAGCGAGTVAGVAGDDDSADEADAGAVDAAPADPVIDGAPKPDAAPIAGRLFAEDFEGFAPGPADDSRWSIDTQAGSLAVDGVQALGTHALHVHTVGNGRAFLRVPVPALPDGELYGRLRVFVTELPSAPDFAHFTLVEAAGNEPGLIRPIGGQYVPAPTAGRSLWGAGSDGGATGDWTNWQVTTPAEAGKWVCLEWRLARDDNRMDVWIDGVEKPELSASTTVHGGSSADFVLPTLTSVKIGWQLYQGGTSPAEFDLWLDDLALATSRVGCAE